MWLSAVAHPSKHISGKWPRKHELHFGLNSLCSHLRWAVFWGPPTEESNPSGRVQLTTTPSHCLLYTFMHPCPRDNLVLKNYFFPGRDRALPVPPTMNHLPSHSGWQCNSQTSGDPLVLMKTHPTAMAGVWPPSHTRGDRPEHPAARVQPAPSAVSFPRLSPQPSWPCRALHPG